MNEAIYQLKTYKIKNVLNIRLNQLIYMPTDDNFVCLTTEQNIQFMKKHCIEYLGDGTINYAPKYFIQLYTVHGYKN